MDTITIGTRESELALEQTKKVIDKLKRLDSKYQFDIKVISTLGDERLDRPLQDFKGQGIFINEFEQAMKNKEIDCAVHSMKDLQTTMADEFTIVAITKREDPREALISNEHLSLHELPTGAVVGTSSSRRIAQLKAIRPDLTTKWIRGPVPSRIEQLREGHFDAIILAVAGLKRLKLDNLITEYLPLESFLPAACQGALAIQSHANYDEMKEIMKPIHDDETALATQTERALLHILDPEEQAPIGCIATVESGVISLQAMVLAANGEKILYANSRGTDGLLVAKDVANLLFEQGAHHMIEDAKDR